MAGLGTYLHAKGLKMGCYTAPGATNCCGEPGSLGHEDVDAAFFAEIGCDHVMSDFCHPYTDPSHSRAEFARLGTALARSANPNMLYGIWHTGFGKSWKWFADEEVGGHSRDKFSRFYLLTTPPLLVSHSLLYLLPCRWVGTTRAS